MRAMADDDNKPKPPPPPAPPAPRIQLSLDDATAMGLYANLVLLNHSETEFVLDFAFLPPAAPLAKVRARVLSSPQHTKKLLKALQKNVERYEARFGVIEVTEDEPTVH